MKLISLNVWGGTCYEELIAYIKEQAKSTDIFCFQEVFSTNSSETESNGIRTNLYQELQLILPDFQGYYSPALDTMDNEGPVPFDLHYGLATFVAKKISIQAQKDIFVYRTRDSLIASNNSASHPRNLQITTIEVDQKLLNILTVHGLWTPDKLDSPDRLEQSRKILNQIESLPGATILCGDFNLRPDTESIKMLEKNLKNLITANHLTATRSSLYTGSEPFADYTFVSPDINVRSFSVPDLPVSDHCPMIVEFDI